MFKPARIAACAALVLVTAAAYAGDILIINTGSSPNDSTGDPLRTAMQKTMTAVNGLASCFNGPTAPTFLMTYQCWFDTSSAPATLRYFDGSQWVAAGTFNTGLHEFSPAGPVGGDLTGVLPNPLIGSGKVTSAKLASGAASANVGTLAGVLGGTLPNPTMAAGAASANVGALGGDLSGLLPTQTIAKIQGTAVTGTTGTGKVVFDNDPTIDSLEVATGLNIQETTSFGPGVRGPLYIQTNPTGTIPAGQVAGLAVWVGDLPTATPGANNPEAALIAIVNGNNRFSLFGLNIICGIGGTINGPDFIDSPCMALEVDLFNTPDYPARNRFATATTGTYSKVALGLFNSPAVAQVTAALAIWTPAGAVTGAFYEGISMSRVSDIGLHFLSDPDGFVDSYNAFGVCAICDNSRSATFAKFGAFTHSGAMIDNSGGAVFTGGFYKGNALSNTNVLFRNSSDFNFVISIDSGSSATQQSVINFQDRGAVKWSVGKHSDNTFLIHNAETGLAPFVINGDTLIDGVPVTVANLPACNATLKYGRRSISDSTASPVGYAAATGGGAVAWRVFCDGTTWRNQ